MSPVHQPLAVGGPQPGGAGDSKVHVDPSPEGWLAPQPVIALGCAYYGVTGNIRSLQHFFWDAVAAWHKMALMPLARGSPQVYLGSGKSGSVPDLWESPGRDPRGPPGPEGTYWQPCLESDQRFTPTDPMLTLGPKMNDQGERSTVSPFSSSPVWEPRR